MKAVILCGGKGTRLRPYTYSVPKPMLMLGKKPILEYVVDNLRKHDFKDIIITTGYRKEQIMEYFGDGSKFGVKITYAQEDEANPLNTAGSILPVKNSLENDSFLVVMGDHMTNINLKKFFDDHKKSGCIATLALKKTGTPLEYGVAHIDENNAIERFEEKPIVQNLINSGIYAFEPIIFKYIKEKDDFAKNVFPRLLETKNSIHTYTFEEYWLDVGRKEDYEKLNDTIATIEIVLGV